MAGAPASSASPTKADERRRLLHQRRGDADALGDVVQREAEHEEGAEPRGAGREGGADREALAEVVQADAERDGGRERQPGRGAAAAADDPQQEEADARPRAPPSRGPGRRRPPRRPARARPRASRRTGSASRPMVRASRKLMPCEPTPAQHRVEHQADGDRHDADEGAEQRLRHELARLRLRRRARPPRSRARRSPRSSSGP